MLYLYQLKAKENIMKNYLKYTLVFTSIISIIIANEPNTDRLGSDYKSIENLTIQSCENACNIEKKCKAWTFVKPNTIQGPKSHCYLKNSIPHKTYNEACISGLSTVSYDEVERVVADEGRHVRFIETAPAASLVSGSLDKLEEIVDIINRNGKTKLYISIKKKAGGLANQRVKKMKDKLAHLGLSPSRYHIQKLTKKDKKNNWLSQNHHLWMRVVPLRD